MQIKYLAHSAFLVAPNNLKIVTDPYQTGNGLNFKPVQESASIVTSSHSHSDHSYYQSIQGNPTIVNKTGRQVIEGIEFRGITAFHDDTGGSQRGNNIVFCFTVEDINLCHLGDLGHKLSKQQLSEIGRVDVLFVPVGGFFTIDAATAITIVQSLKPKIVFPMHYKTPQLDYPIAPVEDFLQLYSNVRRLDGSEFQIRKESLPATTEIIYLKPAY